MADSNNHRLPPDVRQTDLDVLNSIADLKVYTPANAKFTLAELNTSKAAMETAQRAEATASKSLDTARDNAATAEYAFHQKILGGKKQVEAQYGDDSNEYQSLGLKKKSEYAKPKSKGKAKPDEPAK